MERDSTLNFSLPRLPAGPARLDAFLAFLDGLDAAMLAAEQAILGGGFPVGPEAPQGVADGINRVFTLSQAPLYRTAFLNLGGWWLVEGEHFSIDGATLTYAPGLAPRPDEPQAIAYLVGP